MLRVLACLQHAGDQTAGGRTNVQTPMDQALRAPLQVSPVGLGQMFDNGGELAPVSAAHVACHTLATMQDLHGALCRACLQMQSNQGVGDAVIVLLKRDV